MGDFEPAFVHELSVQSWSLYSVGMLLILIRVYARIHRLGIRNLQADDFLMIWAACLYTVLIVCLNVISGGGGSNLYVPVDYVTFTPQNIRDRIKGSKIVVISEQAMLNLIYTIKACMLLMYTRLTLGLQTQRFVLYLSIYVFCGWLGTEIAFFTACTPFSGYWALPPPSPQCTTLQNYAIIQGAFNISSDTLMLFIPLPLITRLSIPLKQKSVLFVIFSMGLFVIIAAILTKVFNLMNIWDPDYMLWYVREASVAVYVSNLPLIWPLMREWFPILAGLVPGTGSARGGKSRNGRGTGTGTGTDGGYGGRRGLASRVLSGGGFGGKRLNDEDDEVEMNSEMNKGVMTTISHPTTKSNKEGSMEELEGSGGSEMEMGEIVRVESWENSGHGSGNGEWKGEMGITMTTTVQISEEHVKDETKLTSPSAVAVVHQGLSHGVGLGSTRVEKEVPKGFQWGFDHDRSNSRR